MGKKRIEKFERVASNLSRRVMFCKRKKGLIKKMIELSILCDLKIFALIQDEASCKTIHFSSHKDFDFVKVFNDENQREFYSISDYERVGGNKDEVDSQFNASDGSRSQDHHPAP